jgi:DNA-directed RNA polymerase subunit RPC12/RpoP
MSQRVTLRYQCPRCETQNSASGVTVGTQLQCSQCDWKRTVDDADLDGDKPRRCLVCGTPDVWRQKDFPQTLGFAFVAIGAVGSSIAWYYHRPLTALGILLTVAAIDFLLFLVMPDVLVCYRCRARHSGEIGGHPTFDHEMAERYRQERLRLGEHGSDIHS